MRLSAVCPKFGCFVRSRLGFDGAHFGCVVTIGGAVGWRWLGRMATLVAGAPTGGWFGRARVRCLWDLSGSSGDALGLRSCARLDLAFGGGCLGHRRRAVRRIFGQ